MSFYISGIQQMGIGVRDVKEAYAWYNRNLGFDVKIFEEAAVAERMLPYTGGMPQRRHAILALNRRGGGGFEIWQYTERVPLSPSFAILPGDIGIYACILKTTDISKCHRFLAHNRISASGIFQNAFTSFFYFRDLYGNIFKVVEFPEQFRKTSCPVGGVCGAIVGVSDLHASALFYRNVLGFSVQKLEDSLTEEEAFFLSGRNEVKARRMILFKPEAGKGPFAPLLGSAFVELIKAEAREPKKIFEGRQWGDLGFIHLCFDVVGMRNLEKYCHSLGSPFTVDGGDAFEMGEAAGHFTYIEDPDGTLIEFVETKKIPLIKKLGWYLDLRKREEGKPLPRWMLYALSLNQDRIR